MADETVGPHWPHTQPHALHVGQPAGDMRLAKQRASDLVARMAEDRWGPGVHAEHTLRALFEDVAWDLMARGLLTAAQVARIDLKAPAAEWVRRGNDRDQWPEAMAEPGRGR